MRPADLFAVQPRVALEDYLDEAAFAARHRRLAERVAELRDPALPALAVWPEYVATFLTLLGQGDAVRGCRTTDEALRRVVARRLPRLARTLVRRRSLALTPAVLTMLAPRALAAYVATFGRLAREHDLWVVAGSGLFPHGGRLYNASYTFAPDGTVAAVTRKVNLVPTQEDVLGLSAGRVEDLPAIDTPLGRLGTLVCYDGFAEPHTSLEREPGWRRCAPELDRRGVEVIAQPSANAWAWEEPWAFNAPGEGLLRSEQWFREGLASELAGLRNVRYAVNPQLAGSVLDATFEAPSLILGRGAGGAAEVLARASDPRGEEVLHLRAEP